MSRALAVVLLLLLAGCTSADKPASDDAPAPRTGISGVVVTPTIQPIPSATLTLEPGGQSATSDLFGRFRFLTVDAGTYTLTATAAGHDPTTMTVQVEDGETARPRVVLEPIRPPIPGHETLDFRGYIQASLGAADPHVGAAKNATDLDRCTCVFDFDAPRFVTAVVIEATWQDNVEGVEPTRFRWNLSAGNVSVSGSGPDPLRAVVDDDAWPGAFPYPGRFTLTLLPDETWPASEQEFDLFATIFVVDPPPDGWSFIQNAE